MKTLLKKLPRWCVSCSSCLLSPLNLPSSAMQKKQNLIGRDARATEGVDIKPNNMQRGYIYTY